MPETQTAIADIHMLDRGYSREARSLLYQAYRHEPTFGYLFEAERPGYEQRCGRRCANWSNNTFCRICRPSACWSTTV
jgi:hypothetical protein